MAGLLSKRRLINKSIHQSINQLINQSINQSIAILLVSVMELVGPSYRMIAGIALELFWACGAIVLALLAYLIRDWRYLNLAVSLPALLFIPYVW